MADLSLVSSAAVPPPLGCRYTVRGRGLAAYRCGSGAPAVIFLPGAGLVGLDYLNLQRRIARLTSTLAYDRAGTGWSDPVALPRGAGDVVRELRELLAVAEVSGPYLLVGHSLGGAYARRFAQLFAGETCGLVLLDPFHEDLHLHAPREVREQLEAMHRREIPQPTVDQLRAGRHAARCLFASWPDQVREALIEHHVTAAWRAGLQEDRNLYDEVAGELRRGTDLPDVPLIVLTALGADDTQTALWGCEVSRAINDGKATLHAELAASVPRGEQRILHSAGHGWLHEQRQDDVLAAINEIIGTVRHG